MASTDKSEQLADSDLEDNLVSTYAAELEVEVDRLRIRDDFLRNEATEFLSRVTQWMNSGADLKADGSARTRILAAADHFRETLLHLKDQPADTSAPDNVVSVELKELIEQVFRTQQRVHRANDAVLHLLLQSETIPWFPNRLRHILQNLVGNALRYRDPSKGETRVSVAVKASDGQFELRISDNGAGISTATATSLLDLPHRAAHKETMHSSIGLAVVQYLVHQCCGSVELQSHESQGTSIVVLLPRFVTGDYLESDRE